jgi:hypothetical protein
MTLIEVLVAMGLAFVVLGLVLQLVLASAALMDKESAQAQGQQATLLVLSKIQTGLGNTVPETITMQTSPPAISFQPILTDPSTSPFSSQGCLFFDNQVEIFSLDSQGRVWNMLRPAALYGFTNNTQPVQLTSAQLAAVTPLPTDRILARSITSLTWGQPASGPPIFPMEIRVVAQITEFSTDNSQTWEMVGEAMPRNMTYPPVGP